MNGEELSKILCRLEPGMSLIVPDEWIDRIIPGTRLARARLVDDIAHRYHCVCTQDLGSQRFEKIKMPPTG